MADNEPMFYDFKSLIESVDRNDDNFWYPPSTTLSNDFPLSPPTHYLHHPPACDSLFVERKPTSTHTGTAGGGGSGEWVVISGHAEKGMGKQTQAVNVELKENGDVEIEIGERSEIEILESMADDYLEQLAPDDAYLSCEFLFQCGCVWRCMLTKGRL
jgi:hypothetical protein